MDGLRYYVGSIILCATSAHAAQDYKEPLSPKLKMLVALPKGSKLYTSSHTLLLPVKDTAITIATIKNIFNREIEKLSQQQPTCSCGGPCADIRAAQVLVKYKDKPLQIAFLGAEAKDTATLRSLHFDAKEDALYAKY